MKREDLHLRVLRVKVTGGDNLEGYRPVTDAEALRMLLFDVCGNYAPHANCNYSAACIKGMLHCNKCGFIEQCPACGGSEQTPKDGVEPFGYLDDTTGHHTTYWMIPASMLDPEGDTDAS